MPREITSHQVNPCNKSIHIFAMDGPGAGGASTFYSISLSLPPGTDPETATAPRFDLHFQNGPVAPDGSGVNGITHEVLIAVLIDRITGFQSGPFACKENADALVHLIIARDILESRTRTREAAGVEGTHQQTPPGPAKTYHPAVASVLQFFAFAHLPPHLQDVSRPFCELATKIADGPQNAEATVALRKLLEAKDAAVRAVVFRAVS